MLSRNIIIFILFFHSQIVEQYNVQCSLDSTFSIDKTQRAIHVQVWKMEALVQIDTAFNIFSNLLSSHKHHEPWVSTFCLYIKNFEPCLRMDFSFKSTGFVMLSELHFCSFSLFLWALSLVFCVYWCRDGHSKCLGWMAVYSLIIKKEETQRPKEMSSFCFLL